MVSPEQSKYADPLSTVAFFPDPLLAQLLDLKAVCHVHLFLKPCKNPAASYFAFILNMRLQLA